MITLTYLKQKEWSMGCGGDRNDGQCPECYGLKPGNSWKDHPAAINKMGHKKDCLLNKAIQELKELEIVLCFT